MKKISLEVREKEFPILLQFLSTLHYVRITEPLQVNPQPEENQLQKLKDILQKQPTPLNKDISDPLSSNI